MSDTKKAQTLAEIVVNHDLDYLRCGEIELKRRGVEVINAKAQREKDAKKLDLEISKQTGRRMTNV